MCLNDNYKLDSSREMIQRERIISNYSLSADTYSTNVRGYQNA